MPTPSLIATAGSSTANSYATVAEGDAYHDARLFSTDWTDASTATKTVALIMATRLLDAMYEWKGYQTVPQTQALQWPRAGLLYRGDQAYVPNDIIPADLKNATAEFARQLIVADRSADSDVETQGIKALSAGPISLTFKDDVQAKVMPDAVRNLLPQCWGYVRGSRGTRPLVRA